MISSYVLNSHLVFHPEYFTTRVKSLRILFQYASFATVIILQTEGQYSQAILSVGKCTSDFNKKKVAVLFKEKAN